MGETEDVPAEPPRSSARTLLVAGVIVVLLAAGGAVLALRGGGGAAADGCTTGEAAPVEEGAPPPELVPDCPLEPFADGPAIALADYRGTPLVVNFWATWCGPCVAEMPDLQAVSEQAGDAVAFLGVNTMDSYLNAEPFAEELGITYDLAVDTRGALYRAIGGFGMPTTLLIDADGAIAFRQTGPVDAQRLRELIAEHLGVQVSALDPADVRVLAA